jgi:hypothetical protein
MITGNETVTAASQLCTVQPGSWQLQEAQHTIHQIGMHAITKIKHGAHWSKHLNRLLGQPSAAYVLTGSKPHITKPLQPCHISIKCIEKPDNGWQ